MLEIISGQPVLTRTRDNVHIVKWAVSLVAKGDIESIMDPMMQVCYDVDMAWKVVNIAVSCVARSSSDRPTMNRVVLELKDCLSTELSIPKDVSEEVESKDTSSSDIISGLNP